MNQRQFIETARASSLIATSQPASAWMAVISWNYIRLNYNDLTTSLEGWLAREIIPIQHYFRLMNYYDLPILHMFHIHNGDGSWTGFESEPSRGMDMMGMGMAPGMGAMMGMPMGSCGMAPYGMGMACAPMGMTPQVPQGQGSGWGKVTLKHAGFHHHLLDRSFPWDWLPVGNLTLT